MIDTVEIEKFLKELSETNFLDDNVIVQLADGELYDVEIDIPLSECEQRRLKELGYEHIIQEGGGKDWSEYCYAIFRLKDKFYKVKWWYDKYEGYINNGALNTLTEVKPKEKLITEIEEFLKALSPKNKLNNDTIVDLADGNLCSIFIDVEIKECENQSLLEQQRLEELGYKYIRQGAGSYDEGYTQGIFELNNRFYSVEWLNTRYGGVYTDKALQTLKEVKPKEKTIVVYEYI